MPRVLAIATEDVADHELIVERADEVVVRLGHHLREELFDRSIFRWAEGVGEEVDVELLDLAVEVDESGEVGGCEGAGLHGGGLLFVCLGYRTHRQLQHSWSPHLPLTSTQCVPIWKENRLPHFLFIHTIENLVIRNSLIYFSFARLCFL